MKFSVQLPTEHGHAPDEFLTAPAIGEMARAAEAAGFDAVFVTDHPIPEDGWLESGGHHTLDPFVALGIAAAATTRLRLQTNVLVLPYRNPFLSAKAAATVDVASGGRLILGVAAGYLEGEFSALGVDFDARNELSDEAIQVMKRVWSESGVKVSGHGFEAPGNTALPRPVQTPHPPIWVGGNSKRAIRRAVELADGWLPFPVGGRMASRIRTGTLRSLEDLEARLDYAREHAAKIGRETTLDVGFVPFGFEIHDRAAFDEGAMRSQVARLADLGVTWLMINVPCETRADYLERVADLGERVVSALRSRA